jgi:hypothetical protein
MDSTTRVGVIVTLPIPTANVIPTFSVAIQQAANAFDLTNIWIDAEVAGDGVQTSVVVV